LSDEYLIRCATNEDGEAIRFVVSSVLREFGLTPDPRGTDADLEDIETSYLQSGGSFDVLIDPSKQVVGTVGLFRLDGQRCELRKMYLAAKCRGLGLGKRLLLRARERAVQLGFQRIELKTHSSLLVASRMYESFGFKPLTLDPISDRCDKAYYLDLKTE